MALNRTDILFELYSIGRKFRSLAKEKNSDTMLTAVILRALKREAMSVSHLGVLVSMKPSAMSEKVQALLGSGLVRREQSVDERELVIAITAKGRHKLTFVLKQIQSHVGRKFGSISDEEMTALVAILKKITETL